MLGRLQPACNFSVALVLIVSIWGWGVGLELERLVYESKATGTTESLGNLVVILAESQKNNARDGLTGALAAHRERYIQVVEGPAQALDSLLRRLEDDPRHKDVTLLDRQPISERLFGAWTMASARITPAYGEALDRLVEGDELTPPKVIRILLDAVRADQFEKAVSAS
ncbi:BLUF domain-containing protein [Roseibacterium beibuensis]|uniref:BLUF domain-containing protein n=1 Tax=[Roseibacterium] beibuensis TaxID=1193142 RepID=UPI00217D825A|nr:BLUF domain-containing protein [Roseibacterium beibuensis]MCS6624495.1 BLUF domain-containing protein [Roseibacterium beibuensis]